jgi:hypothetical protein
VRSHTAHGREHEVRDGMKGYVMFYLAMSAFGAAWTTAWTSLALRRFPGVRVSYTTGPLPRGWLWRVTVIPSVLVIAMVGISLWLLPLCILVMVVVLDGPIWRHNRRVEPNPRTVHDAPVTTNG